MGHSSKVYPEFYLLFEETELSFSKFFSVLDTKQYFLYLQQIKYFDLPYFSILFSFCFLQFCSTLLLDLTLLAFFGNWLLFYFL